MLETGIREYIEKRLSALDLINPDPDELPATRLEIIIGIIRKERTKKLLVLSKKISGEIEQFNSKLENNKHQNKREIKSWLFSIAKLDAVKKVLDAEFYASLFFEFPCIEDHTELGLFVGVRKDWRVFVANKEVTEALSEFIVQEKIRKEFSSPSEN